MVKCVLGVESTAHTFGVNGKAYKFGSIDQASSFRTVTIFPGDLVVAGCFCFSGGFI